MARTSARNSSSEGHAAHAKAQCEANTIGASDTHLRAAVNFEIRRNLARQLHDTDVLHDDRIGSGLRTIPARARVASPSSWSKTNVLNVT